MARDVVIMMDPAEQEALRSGGVLPVGMFRSFDDLANGNVEDGKRFVFLWPHLPDYGLPEPGRTLSLPELMGLPNAGEEELVSEAYIARLFGKLLVHVAFLEPKGALKDRQATFTGRRSTFDTIDSVLEWSDRLDEAVKARLYEEQARQINHVLVLVARGGQVAVTDEEVAKLRSRFSTVGNMRACYFLDYNLEVEDGDHLLHSTHVWPIMLGRLFLRFLLDGSTGSAQDGFLAPGFHLWRAMEFRFEYPEAELDELLSDKLKDVYAKICQVSATNAEADADTAADVSGDECGFGEQPELGNPSGADDSGGSWVTFPSRQYAAGMGDDRRWWKAIAGFRDDFRRIESHRDVLKDLTQGFAGRNSCVRIGDNDARSVQLSAAARVGHAVFSAVRRHPRNVFAAANEIELRLASLRKIDPMTAFRNWQSLVAKEKERASHKALLERTAAEFAEAQDHYLLRWVGMLAMLSVSLFCCLTVQRLVYSIGGSPIVSWALGGCPVVGALAAWLSIDWLHSRAGRKGLAELKAVGAEVDSLMVERCDQAFSAADSAEKDRRLIEKRNLFGSLLAVLKRIRRILDREIQSPSAVVFFHNEEDEKKKRAEKPDFAARQIAEFLSKTRMSDVLTDVGVRDLDAKRVRSEIEEYFGDKGNRVFVNRWNKWCQECDSTCQGNYPATSFVLNLRNFMQEVCDRVSAAMVDDLLDYHDKQGGGGMTVTLPESLTMLRGDSDYTYSSAHVDEEQVQASQSILFVSKRYYTAASANLANTTGEFGFSVRESDLFGRIPQYAFYYQDILVNPERDSNGRLGFSIKQFGT